MTRTRIVASTVVAVLVTCSIPLVGSAAGATVTAARPSKSKSTAPSWTASPIDPAHVIAVSKFRSCSGHDFSPGEVIPGKPAPPGKSGLESARSMKHYLQVDVSSTPANQLPVFAPMAGKVRLETEDTPIGKQVWISAKGWNARIFHVDPTVQDGQQVKAGQQIGTIAPADAAKFFSGKVPGKETMPYEFDVALTNDAGDQYLSMFDVMDAATAAKWAARGYTAQNAIVSKADRNATPCTLQPNSDYFVQQNDDSADWVRAA